jgi:hypothetical protein
VSEADAKVVTLRKVEAQPNAAVTELAEKVLAMAKSGDLIGLGYVGVHAGRADGSAFEIGDGTIAGLVLGCCRLKVRLLAEGEP